MRGHYFQTICLVLPECFFLVAFTTLPQYSFGQESSKASVAAKLQSLTQEALRAEKAKDYAAAAAAYERLAALRPGDSIAHQSLGLAWYLQGSYANAVKPLEQALVLNPQLWAARLYLGVCYYRTNQFQKAVDSLRLAVQAKPKETMPLSTSLCGGGSVGLGGSVG